MSNKLGNEVSTLLHTLLERCKKEKDRGSILVPLDDYYERVSYYTAYPKTLIKEVTGIADTKEKQFNLESHILLLVSIKTTLNLKLEPTLQHLFTIYQRNKDFLVLQNKAVVSSMANFCSQIGTLKYEFRKTAENNLILIENPKVTFERYHYLSKIKKYRIEKKVIYFIDERVFDSSLSYSKPTLDTREEAEDVRCHYTVFLMISSNGYEQCLFTAETIPEVYKRWIENIVLSKLPPCSTVVLTNSYLHGNEKNTITRYHNKRDMMEYLRDHGVPHSNDMCKAELFSLIENCTTRTKLNDIDRLFKSYGHEVLRLPSTFEEISPIEFMWEHVRADEFLIKNEDVYSAKNKLYTYLSTLQDSMWKSFFGKSHKFEDEIFLLDKEIEAHYDSICKLDDKSDLEGSCVCNFYHSVAVGSGFK